MNAPPTSSSPRPPGSRAPWPVWQRVAFRYLLLHWLFYAMPQPLSSLLGTLAHYLRLLQGELEARFEIVVDPTSWTTGVFTAFGKLEEGWQWLTSKLYEHGLTPVEVIHQRTGSGDTGHDFVKLGCIVVISLVLTLVWSLLDRRPSGHPVLGRWTHLGARWWLAFWMLSYGTIKLYAGQFVEPSLSGLTREIGDKTPMGMVWTFIGASKAYEVFGGIGEITGGLLLFHRRTALLGCLVTIAVMTNVCALNWLYDVPVKLFSTHLWLAAVLLMAPWRERLRALLITNEPSQPVDMAVFQRAWLGWALVSFGWLWAVGTLVQSHYQNTAQMEQRETFLGKPELYGLWQVEKMVRDGEEIPLADSSRWELFAIDRGKRAWSRALVGQVHAFAYSEDLAAGTITLTESSGGEELTWTVERGTQVVQVPHPAPRTMQDYNASVDAERPTIVFRGRWNGEDLELHTVQKEFPLHSGFHWVQEIPYNR